jgi:hypothetical protein
MRIIALPLRDWGVNPNTPLLTGWRSAMGPSVQAGVLLCKLQKGRLLRQRVVNQGGEEQFVRALEALRELGCDPKPNAAGWDTLVLLRLVQFCWRMRLHFRKLNF